MERNDGAALAPGDVIAIITGPARGILTAERVALNFLCRLSGIATATATVVAAVRGLQGEDRLHAQDDAGPARDRKIRGPHRRRQQSSVRPRRCRADQGQSCRHRRERYRGVEAGAEAASAISSRSNSKSIRSISCARRSITASMPCFSTTWTSSNAHASGHDGRRPSGDRGLRPHHARHGAADCRHRRRSDLDRLAYPQRQRSRHRARFPRIELVASRFLLWVDRDQRLRTNRATSSTCGVWRNWSTGVTPSIW